MSLANKVNRKGGTVADGIDTKNLKYMKAKDICFEDGDPIRLRGFFFQNGKFGKSITLVTDKIGINVPERYVKMFEEYTPEEVEQIKQGHLGISKIYMIDTDNGQTPMLEFVDLDVDEVPFK